MRTNHRTRTTALRIAASLLALTAPTFARAQQPPSLDTILERLEANLQHYHTQVPSFLCDEHAESQVTPGTAEQDTATDSVFRLRRDPAPRGHGTVLNESRDIKTVNGRPANGDEINGPSILSGAFSGGLAVVSLSQKACMSYKLKPIKSNHPTDPYIVEFSSLPARERTAGVTCVLNEKGNGRALIDPASMQITHLELTAPDHIINAAVKQPHGLMSPAVIGPWVVTVDYAPVKLGGQTFWMPSYISSTMTHDDNQSISINSGRRVGNFETNNSTVWSFQASYTHYHKLEVTTRIVPVDGNPPAPPSAPTHP